MLLESHAYFTISGSTNYIKVQMERIEKGNGEDLPAAISVNMCDIQLKVAVTLRK